jgi:hypothetical protein
VEVLERRGEGGEASLLQERSQARLDPGLLPQVSLLGVARLDVVGRAVLREEPVDLGVRTPLTPPRVATNRSPV